MNFYGVWHHFRCVIRCLINQLRPFYSRFFSDLKYSINYFCIWLVLTGNVWLTVLTVRLCPKHGDWAKPPASQAGRGRDRAGRDQRAKRQGPDRAMLPGPRPGPGQDELAAALGRPGWACLEAYKCHCHSR